MFPARRMCRNSAFRAGQGALADLGSPRQAVTLLRLEGITASAAHRAASLSEALRQLRSRGDCRRCGFGRDLEFGPRRRAVRGRRRAGSLAGVAHRLPAGIGRGARPGAVARYRRRRDLRLGRRIDLGGVAALRRCAVRACCAPRVDAVGGHATLIRASEPVRRDVDVFHPQQSGLAALERARPPQLRSEKHSQSRPAGARARGMKTEFSLAQLADPDIAEADKILRACVHCGFCTATCPTYVLLGDELDSPRGRIYLIKEMLEKDKPPTEEVVKHIDRCLSCLACMTTCPSGRELHAPGRSGAGQDREGIHPAADRARVARGAGLGAAAAKTVSRQHDPGAAGTAAGGAVAGVGAGSGDAVFISPNQGDAGAGAARIAGARPGAAAAYFRRIGRSADGSRCCKAAPSRCWRRASTRRPSAC